MSQEKVDRYKEQKKNRKAIQVKKKRKALIEKICAGVIVLALVCWIGYSVYDIATRPDTSALPINKTALDAYLNGMEEQ